MNLSNNCHAHHFLIIIFFQQSLLRHEKLNVFEAKNGGHAIYGVNKFSDLTQEEFRGKF